MEGYFTAFDVFAEVLKGNHINNLEICDSSRYIPGSFGSFKWRTDLVEAKWVRRRNGDAILHNNGLSVNISELIRILSVMIGRGQVSVQVGDKCFKGQLVNLYNHDISYNAVFEFMNFYGFLLVQNEDHTFSCFHENHDGTRILVWTSGRSYAFSTLQAYVVFAYPMCVHFMFDHPDIFKQDFIDQNISWGLPCGDRLLIKEIAKFLLYDPKYVRIVARSMYFSPHGFYLVRYVWGCKASHGVALVGFGNKVLLPQDWTAGRCWAKDYFDKRTKWYDSKGNVYNQDISKIWRTLSL